MDARLFLRQKGIREDNHKVKFNGIEMEFAHLVNLLNEYYLVKNNGVLDNVIECETKVIDFEKERRKPIYEKILNRLKK